MKTTIITLKMMKTKTKPSLYDRLIIRLFKSSKQVSNIMENAIEEAYQLGKKNGKLESKKGLKNWKKI